MKNIKVVKATKDQFLTDREIYFNGELVATKSKDGEIWTDGISEKLATELIEKHKDILFSKRWDKQIDKIKSEFGVC